MAKGFARTLARRAPAFGVVLVLVDGRTFARETFVTFTFGFDLLLVQHRWLFGGEFDCLVTSLTLGLRGHGLDLAHELVRFGGVLALCPDLGTVLVEQEWERDAGNGQEGRDGGRPVDAQVVVHVAGE